MPDPILTLASVPAIIALTNLAKGLGLNGRWSALLAVVLGVALNLAAWAWAGQAWYSFAVEGVILGLGASGVYDLTPQPQPRRAAEPHQ